MMSETEKPNDAAPNSYVSVKVAKERTGLSDSWYYKEIKEGRLRHFRIGRRVLLDPRDVDARIAKHEVNER